MKKSAVTEFFLEYFEKNRICREWISECTGIRIEKISENYGQPLNATEFLELCMFLGIKPETVQEYVKQHSDE